MITPFACTYLETYNAIVATFSCIAAIIGIPMAVSALRQSRKIAEEQLINSYNHEYAESTFKLALQKLYDFEKDNKDHFCNVRSKTNNELNLHFKGVNKLSNHESVDSERRIVKFFFLNALQLLENGTLSKQSFLQIVNKDGLCAMFKIIEVLEWNINSNYNSERFQKLMNETSSIYEGICKRSIS